MAATYPDAGRAGGDYTAPSTTHTTSLADARTVLVNTISWSAVIAGVVVALVAQMLLNLGGIGFGAATIDPTAADGSPSAQTFSVSAGLWWVGSGVVASFLGGIAAGRLGGRPKRTTSAWHGLIAWALTTLIVVYLVGSTVTSVVGSAARTMGSVVGGVTQSIGSTARTALEAAAPQIAEVTDPFASIERSVRDATGGNDPQALRDAAVSAVRAAVTADPGEAQAARDRAAQAIAEARNIPVEEAQAQVQQYEQQYRETVNQVQQQATQAAEATANTVTQGALYGTIALLLGALAGWLGGLVGSVRPISYDRY